MSRRRNPGDPRRAAGAGRASAAAPSPKPGASGRAPSANRPDPAQARSTSGQSAVVQFGIVIGVFVVATLLAELFGAANLGVAIGVGQVAFAVAVVAVLLRGS